MHNHGTIKIGNGEIGGKGSGLLKVMQAFQNISNTESPPTENIKFPKTVFVTTSVFESFVEFNNLRPLILKVEKDNFNVNDCEALRKAFLESKFSPEMQTQLLEILKIFSEPIVVRSSSLLEDQKGAAFAGKYESVFVGNQGDNESREKLFLDAVKKVYSTTYNPNALAYRCKHNFMDETEEMALVVQGVVGHRHNSYYLPAMAGVGFSQNGYCWNKDIKKSDGLIRLVFGLGTCAVGRGYVRLFSPTRPDVRPEGTDVNNIQKCSQKKVDVIDLENNTLKTVHFRELIKDGFNSYLGAQAMVSLRDGFHLYKPVSNMWDSTHIPVLTMDGALTSPWMNLNIAKTLHWLLQALEKELKFAIDLEFAIDVDPNSSKASLYILQTRPLSERTGRAPEAIPNLKDEDIVFSMKGSLPTAYIPNIEYLVFVDDATYRAWPHREKQSVARVIGKINEALKDKKFSLIGPGRWGSWNPELGVPVNYSEISNCCMLIEVARRSATYIPEVSFGSHFFQDLIEDNIAYLPIYPDEPHVIFNENMFSKKSVFSNILSEEYFRQFDNLIKIIHVPTSFKNKTAHAILNGELETAVFFIK